MSGARDWRIIITPTARGDLHVELLDGEGRPLEAEAEQSTELALAAVDAACAIQVASGHPMCPSVFAGRAAAALVGHTEGAIEAGRMSTLVVVDTLRGSCGGATHEISKRLFFRGLAALFTAAELQWGRVEALKMLDRWLPSYVRGAELPAREDRS